MPHKRMDVAFLLMVRRTVERGGRSKPKNKNSKYELVY